MLRLTILMVGTVIFCVPPLQGGEEKERQLSRLSVQDMRGLKLRVTHERESFSYGEPVIMSLWLVNSTKEERKTSLAFFHSLKVTVEEVLDLNTSRPVGLTAYGQAKFENQKFWDVSLKPGEGVKFDFWLSRIYDLSRTGKYRVHVVFEEPDAAGKSASIELKDIPIKITETEPTGYSYHGHKHEKVVLEAPKESEP